MSYKKHVFVTKFLWIIKYYYWDFLINSRALNHLSVYHLSRNPLTNYLSKYIYINILFFINYSFISLTFFWFGIFMSVDTFLLDFHPQQGKNFTDILLVFSPVREFLMKILFYKCELSKQRNTRHNNILLCDFQKVFHRMNNDNYRVIGCIIQHTCVRKMIEGCLVRHIYVNLSNLLYMSLFYFYFKRFK